MPLENNKLMREKLRNTVRFTGANTSYLSLHSQYLLSLSAQLNLYLLLNS